MLKVKVEILKKVIILEVPFNANLNDCAAIILKTYRTIFGATQIDMGKFAGASKHYISRKENGTRTVSLKDITLYAQYGNISSYSISNDIFKLYEFIRGSAV